MIYLLSGANILFEGIFQKLDILIAGEKITWVGQADLSVYRQLEHKLKDVLEIIDCENLHIAPGIIDPHNHLSGGSGEKGFHSQSPPISLCEFIDGGVTTTVGTLGVDTSTKTMSDLLAKVKAFNHIGISAYCYVGGYDIPPKTITGNVRDDLLFISEIIGVGEIAIADRRAPEPSLDSLARACVDAYVGGILSGKAGVSHFHVGPGDRRLQTIRDLLETHSILPEKIYLTHLERSEKLIEEAAELAKRGVYIDFDIYDPNILRNYLLFKRLGGPADRLTISSDGGVPSPSELWSVLTETCLKGGLEISEIYQHFSQNAAQVLGLEAKGKIATHMDADLLMFDKTDLQIKHVMARGKFFKRDGKNTFDREVNLTRRGWDIYGIKTAQTEN